MLDVDVAEDAVAEDAGVSDTVGRYGYEEGVAPSPDERPGDASGHEACDGAHVEVLPHGRLVVHVAAGDGEDDVDRDRGCGLLGRGGSRHGAGGPHSALGLRLGRGLGSGAVH